MAVFGLVFVTVGIFGTYNIIKYIEDQEEQECQ